MTELQAIIMKSLIPLLLLPCLIVCQDAEDVCLQLGDDFRSDKCQATLIGSSVYWRYNGSNVVSDKQAAELGLNITQSYDENGTLHLILTIPDVQSAVNLSCHEGNKTILSYSLRIGDTCEAPLVTGAGTDPPNSTNMTAGSQTVCDTKCIIALTVTPPCAVAAGILIAAVLLYVCRRNKRCLTGGNGTCRRLLDGNGRRPPGGNDRHPCDDDDKHEDHAGNGDSQVSPTVPEDKTEGTCTYTCTINIAQKSRVQPVSDVLRDTMKFDFKADSTTSKDPKSESENINIETPFGEECSDKGGFTPILCSGNKIHVHASSEIPLYEKMTYMCYARPQIPSFHGCDGITTASNSHEESNINFIE